MSTPTIAPALDGVGTAGSTATPQRRRGRAWFVVFAGVVLMTVLVGAFLANYQPLIHGSESGVSVRVKRIEGLVPPDTWVVTYVDGQTFVFAVSIRNDGPVGVTVTSVGQEDPHVEALKAYDGAFRGASEELGLPTHDVRELSPLRPFALAPGHERLVWIRYRFQNCRFYSFGGSSGFTSLPVTFRVLGIPRHGRVNLHTVLEVKSPKDCPDRGETP
jgi:hypothetical protein